MQQRACRRQAWLPALMLVMACAGLHLFQTGFLLTRTALPNVANYAEKSSIPSTEEKSSFSSATHLSTQLPSSRPAYKRLVLIIIDALRFDFVAPPDEHSAPLMQFHRQLNVMYELAAQHPMRSLLYRFVADPPTTTSQRLKALTTGNLPTFIEMGNNFASTEIHEDNLITQLSRAKKRMMFTGDDTWSGLYPSVFNETHYYPSFDVWDLHTVDNGVLKHLIPTMLMTHNDSTSSAAMDVIVAHFLGVDHAGHRYGPDHPAMAEKLRQMDGILREVVSSLPDDMLLVVMGDHGMDPKGDHGGDSLLEVNSALWIYGNHDILATTDEQMSIASLQDILAEYNTHSTTYESVKGWQNRRVVAQIDLVPSLAMFFGIPIPFENLGTIIPELFVAPLTLDATFLSYLRENARQVHNYLEEYANISSSSQLSSSVFQMLSAYYHDAETTARVHNIKDEDALKAVGLYLKFLRETLQTTRSVWAQFNTKSMAIGITIIAVALIIMLLWLTVGLSRHIFAWTPIILPVSTSLVYISNSFVLFEDRETTFCLVLAISIFGVVFKPISPSRRLILTFTALVVSRLAAYITICRKEQVPYCRPTFYESEGKTVASRDMAKLAIFLLLTIVFAWPQLMKFIYGERPQPLQTRKHNTLWMITTSLTAVLCATYWWVEEIVHGHALHELSSRWDVIWLARACFICAIASFTLLQTTSNQIKHTPECILLNVYLLLVPTQKPSALYALTMVFIVILCLSAIVKSSSFDEVLPKKSLSAAVAVESRLSYTQTLQATATASVVHHLSRHVFFTTGHQATLSSIQWSIASTGLYSMNYYFSSSLVVLNFIGPFIFVIIASLSLTTSLTPTHFQKQKQRMVIWLVIWIEILHSLMPSIMAGHHHQHLMVWNIFAPRWMLAVLFLFTTCISSFMCFIYILATTNYRSASITKKEP